MTQAFISKENIRWVWLGNIAGCLANRRICQVAVSLSLACNNASLPVAWQLYLPKEWATYESRRERAGVPKDLQFETKPEIALAQIKNLMYEGAPKHCVLMDAG